MREPKGSVGRVVSGSSPEKLCSTTAPMSSSISAHGIGSSKRTEVNLKDPRARAELYIQTHGIKELFEALGTLLLFHKPDHPREFLIKQLREMKNAKQTQTHAAFFEEHDLEALFAMFDVTNKGSISLQQYYQALRSIGIDQPTLRLPEMITQVNQPLFLRSLTQEIKNASASLM